MGVRGGIMIEVKWDWIWFGNASHPVQVQLVHWYWNFCTETFVPDGVALAFG